MGRKTRKIERRRFKRLEFPLSLSIRLLGTTKYPQRFNAETRNVALEGLSIELSVILKNGSLLIQDRKEHIKVIPFLVLNEKMVELETELPPKGRRIRAIGKVVWYDFGSRRTSYYFRAGIFLEKIGVGDRKEWEEFVKNIEEKRGTLVLKRLISPNLRDEASPFDNPD
jgi:hypothetical protein